MMTFERQQRKSRSTNRKHKITVERPSRTRNTKADGVPVWAAIGSFWMSFDPVTEKQRRDYKNINVEATHFARCSGMADIQENDRLTFRGRFFEVLTATNLHEVDRDKLIVTKEIRPKQVL